MKKFAYLALTIVTFMSINSAIFAQWPYKVFLGGGISTVQFDSKNRSALDYFPVDSAQISSGKWGGGSLDMAQAGIDIHGEMDMDSLGRHIVPFGLDISFLTARERFSGDDNDLSYDLKMVYSTTLLGFYAGYDYAIFMLPKAKAKVYIGGEVRGNLIAGSSVEFTQKYFREAGDSTDVIKYDGKKNTFRLGGNIRLGVIGQLKKDLNINASIAYGALNILGRDDARGELLTFRKSNDTFTEVKENILKALNVSIVLEYRIK